MIFTFFNTVTLTDENMVRPFIDHINQDEEGEAALENQHDDDCNSLLLFQKYNISYQKHLEDKEIRETRIHQETIEDLEYYPSSLFYDKTSLHSSPTNSYGLDSIPCPLRFESKLNKTNTANRRKVFISSEKELELQCNKHGIEYLPPTPDKLPNSTTA